MVGEDVSDVTTIRLEDDGSRLVHPSNVANTFLLASPSDIDSSGSTVYEISGISSDGIVVHTDPHIEEVKYQSICSLLMTDSRPLLEWEFIHSSSSSSSSSYVNAGLLHEVMACHFGCH